MACRIQILLLILTVSLSGCMSKSRAHREAQAAFFKGRESARQEQLALQQPVVHFQGFFKQTTIPWHENLTLAEAILEAEFTRNWQPQEIMVQRRGRTHRIPARDMLSGRNNPVLEPGDLVEIRR